MSCRPFNAWTIHAAALWIWHFPPLFEATLTNDWIHAAQHLSFLGSALLFWWSLFYGRGRHPYGTGVVYIFTTGVHTGILGALLTVTTKVWYPAYGNASLAWGLTPLEDQQLGGLIMWVPASLVYLGAGLTMFGAWMRASEMGASGACEFRKNLCELNVCPQPALRRCWCGDALREPLKLRQASPESLDMAAVHAIQFRACRARTEGLDHRSQVSASSNT